MAFQAIEHETRYLPEAAQSSFASRLPRASSVSQPACRCVPLAPGLGQLPDWRLLLGLAAAAAVVLWLFRGGRKDRRKELERARWRYLAETARIKAES